MENMIENFGLSLDLYYNNEEYERDMEEEY